MFKTRSKNLHQMNASSNRRNGTKSVATKIIGKGISIFKGTKYEIIKYQPRSYDELTSIADQLKTGSSVIVNLKLIEDRRFFRCIDFLSGVLYAINGSIENIGGKGSKIYLLTPKYIEVNKEYKETIANLDINTL